MREEYADNHHASISSPIALKRPPPGIFHASLRACHKQDDLSGSTLPKRDADATQKEHSCQSNDKRRDLQASIKSPINAPKAQPITSTSETPAAARGRNRQSLLPETRRKGDHRTDGEIDPTGEDHKGQPTAMIPRKALSVRILQITLEKRNRETASGSRDSPAQRRRGDHKRQVTFYHGYALL